MKDRRLVSLSEVGKFVRGITFKPTDVVAFGTADSVVCMRTKNVQSDLDESDLISIPSKFIKRNEQMLKEGDLLVSSANSWNLVGKCCWVPSLKYLATAGGFISIFRPDPNVIDRRYLYHWFSSSPTQSRLRQCSRQTTNISNLSIPLAEKLQLHLPPLPEQKRIAAILDKADAIRRKREKAIELTDSFLRSVFLAMFGDPNLNPKGWEVKRVGEVSDCIVPGRDKPRSFTGSVPWVLSDDLVNGGYTFASKSGLGLSDSEIAEVRARRIPSGSVLMTCVGRLGVISIAGCEMVINQQLHSFQCSPLINNLFLLALLPWKKVYMEQHASATTVPYMNKTVCNSIPIIIPPISLQNRFAEIAEAHLRMRERLTQQLAETIKLSLSLSQSLFGALHTVALPDQSRSGLEVAHAL